MPLAALGAVLAAAILACGCGKKPDVKATVSDLEKAFPAAAAQPAPAAAAAPQMPAIQSSAGDANAYVNAAVAAARRNDYAASVSALDRAAYAKGVTAQQLSAIQQAKQAMAADLVRRADQGDASAKAALEAIERTRSQ